VETYFDIEELAKYLCVAERTIRKWVLNREIQYYKIQSVVRFRLSDIEKMVDEKKIKINPKKVNKVLEAETTEETDCKVVDAGATT
jgi:excisionase family DNA binding protein